MTEIWKEIRPGIEVSSKGRVRRYVEGHRDGDGYLCVSGGKRGARRWTIHSLVAEAFLGPRPSGLVVRHRNDDKDDNSVENLAYGTRKENAKDAKTNGKLNFLHSFENKKRLRAIASAGGRWWKGKKRVAPRGKLKA